MRILIAICCWMGDLLNKIVTWRSNENPTCDDCGHKMKVHTRELLDEHGNKFPREGSQPPLDMACTECACIGFFIGF